jgi:hypothetical protein
MMMLNSYSVCLKQFFARSFVTVALASTGLLWGIVPEFSVKTGNFSVNNAVLAQNADFTNEQVTRFARAILSMEPLRQETYNAIKQRIGSGDVPNIVCTQPNSLRGLSREAREIAIAYCERSKAIVESNNLTSQEFNAMTQAASSNPAFKTRVQNELIKLQQVSP